MQIYEVIILPTYFLSVEYRPYAADFNRCHPLKACAVLWPE